LPDNTSSSSLASWIEIAIAAAISESPKFALVSLLNMGGGD
jgi:hypothetical protein